MPPATQDSARGATVVPAGRRKRQRQNFIIVRSEPAAESHQPHPYGTRGKSRSMRADNSNVASGLDGHATKFEISKFGEERMPLVTSPSPRICQRRKWRTCPSEERSAPSSPLSDELAPGGKGSAYAASVSVAPDTCAAVTSMPAVVKNTACPFTEALSTGKGIGTLTSLRCNGERRRSKSRLSLKRSRTMTNEVPSGVLGSSNNSASIINGAGTYRTDRSDSGSVVLPNPQGDNQAQSSSSVTGVMRGLKIPRSAGGTANGEGTNGGDLRGCQAKTAPKQVLGKFLPSEPPFIGLHNWGETCYLNATIQALVASARAMQLLTNRQDDGGCFAAEGDVLAGIVASDERPQAPGSAGEIAVKESDTNPVLDSFEDLLRQLVEANRLSLDLCAKDCDPQAGEPPPFVPVPVPLHLGGADDKEETNAPTPLPSGSVAALGPEAIAPEALVKLVREGCLGGEFINCGAALGEGASRRRFGGLESATHFPGFGGGQECASELLGKLLNLGAIGAVSNKHGLATSLSEAFRGVVSTRTRCVECERHRTRREIFTELLLPRLPRQAPTPPCEPRLTRTASKNPARVARGLQELVDSALGSETLVGENKVWCDFCRQWTEAERQSELHSPPRLLALHLRAATPDRLTWNDHDYGPNGPCSKNEKARDAMLDDGVNEVISRVIEFYGGAMHEVQDGNDGLATPAEDMSNILRGKRGLSPRRISPYAPQSGQATSTYDLVGIILHHDIALGAGHYTFARLVGSDELRASSDVAEAVSKRCISGRIPTYGGRTLVTSPMRDWQAQVRQGSVGTSVRGAVDTLGRTIDARRAAESCDGDEGIARTSWSRSDENGGTFVLFDDACVRWLLPDEERCLLRGAGATSGLGEAFLVFYALRCPIKDGM